MPLPGRDVCIMHAPDQAEKVAAARVKGGTAAAKIRLLQGRRLKLDTPAALVRFTSGIVQDTLAGTVEVDVARTVLVRRRDAVEGARDGPAGRGARAAGRGRAADQTGEASPVNATLTRELERAREQMAALVRPAAAPDPVAFAATCGLDLDDWQRDLLLSDARQMILLCSRQSGKSTISALLGLYEALYRPPALVLLVAPALRQSQELHLKVKDLLRASGEAGQIAEESALRLRFHNGSRIIALPGGERTVRGYSAVSLLIEDEASRVDDALFHATRPMLAVSAP
jgi:hypothetical protein